MKIKFKYLVGLVSSIITAVLAFVIRYVIIKYYGLDLDNFVTNTYEYLILCGGLGGLRFIIREALEGFMMKMDYPNSSGLMMKSNKDPSHGFTMKINNSHSNYNPSANTSSNPNPDKNSNLNTTPHSNPNPPSNSNLNPTPQSNPNTSAFTMQYFNGKPRYIVSDPDGVGSRGFINPQTGRP